MDRQTRIWNKLPALGVCRAYVELYQLAHNKVAENLAKLQKPMRDLGREQLFRHLQCNLHLSDDYISLLRNKINYMLEDEETTMSKLSSLNMCQMFTDMYEAAFQKLMAKLNLFNDPMEDIGGATNLAALKENLECEHYHITQIAGRIMYIDNDSY